MFAPEKIADANTTYGEQWNALRFAEIEKGDAIEKVLSTIGLPLEVQVIDSQTEFSERILSPLHATLLAGAMNRQLVLQYSRCRNRWGDFFKDVEVHVINGVVTSKSDELYHELW